MNNLIKDVKIYISFIFKFLYSAFITRVLLKATDKKTTCIQFLVHCVI